MSPPPAAKRRLPGSENETSLPTTMAEALVHKLGLLIVAGDEVKPGDSLGDEGELLERYGVSRSVLRDAFKILAGKGMIETRRGVGTRVRPRVEWMMLDRDVLAWHQSIGEEYSHLWQQLEVREAIEPLATRLAAQAADAEREQVMAAYREMEAAADSLRRLREQGHDVPPPDPARLGQHLPHRDREPDVFGPAPADQADQPQPRSQQCQPAAAPGGGRRDCGRRCQAGGKEHARPAQGRHA